MKSLAAIAFAPNEPLEIDYIDVQGPKANEVLVQIHATSVCHTDAYTLSGADPEGQFPCVLGHEGAGVVLEIGKGVTRVQPGDHVIPLYVPECQQCKFCLSNKTNLCQAIRQTQGQGIMPDKTSRFSFRNQPLYHFMGTSTFSQLTVIPEIALAKINPQAPFNKICLMGCSITTGIGAVLNTAKVTPGSTVAVFGCGAVGLSVIQGAVMAKASQIIAIDVNESKCTLAKKMGATHTLNPNSIHTSTVDAIIEMSQGGVDFSFECIGNTQIMRQALECCHKGWGLSTIIGVASQGEEICTLPFQLVTGRTWKGSAFGGVKGVSELPKMIEHVMDETIQVEPFISEELKFEEINVAFDHLKQGKTIRSVLSMPPLQ